MDRTCIAELPDRAVLAVTGADATDFLQGLLSNDVRRDGAAYAALLTPQGKFLHDMLLVPIEDGFLMDCPARGREDLLKRLRMYRLRAKVDLADRSSELSVLALFHPPAGPDEIPPDIVTDLAAAGMVAPYRDPRLAALGWRAFLPRGQDGAPAQVNASAADYDLHRLALVIPDGDRDIETGKGLLLESNFEELHGVDFAKGCYVGQELTARTKHRALVRKRLWGVRAEAGLPPSGTRILLQDQDAGQMGSSRDGVGLALLRLDKLRQSLSTGAPLMADGIELQPFHPPYLGAMLPQDILSDGDPATAGED